MIDIEAIEKMFCHNNLNLTYEAAKTGFNFLLHKMRLFCPHFGFGLGAGVEAAPTKKIYLWPSCPLYGDCFWGK